MSKRMFRKAPGPPEYRVVTSPFCCEGCGTRPSCQWSEVRFTDHCCRRCAESGGLEHHVQCDRLSQGAYTLQVGDVLELDIMSSNRDAGTAYGTILELLPYGHYRFETTPGAGWTLGLERYGRERYRCWEHPDGGRLCCGDLAPKSERKGGY